MDRVVCIDFWIYCIIIILCKFIMESIKLSTNLVNKINNLDQNKALIFKLNNKYFALLNYKDYIYIKCK